LGAAALTDPELLCMVLGSGRRAHALAESLLASSGGLKALVQEDPNALCARKGLGAGRAAQVLAALELGRRAQRVTERRPRLRTPREIYAYLAPSLSALRREVFHVLCFNARNVLLLDVRVAEGTINSCPVDPREVFAAAITSRATAIVLAHNHPSGDPEPSAQDLGLTAQLIEASRWLGIKVLDHVVVGDGAYTSMLERGELPLLGAEASKAWGLAGGRGS
jgi:DNA repair protein RadC